MAYRISPNKTYALSGLVRGNLGKVTHAPLSFPNAAERSTEATVGRNKSESGRQRFVRYLIAAYKIDVALRGQLIIIKLTLQ